MEMFLMILCMSFFTLAIMAAALGAAAPPPAVDEPKKELPAVPASNFFSDSPAPSAPYNHVPIEALLAQIENHIRLEHAAAETFLSAPSPALLHNKTISKFVN